MKLGGKKVTPKRAPCEVSNASELTPRLSGGLLVTAPVCVFTASRVFTGGFGGGAAKLSLSMYSECVDGANVMNENVSPMTSATWVNEPLVGSILTIWFGQ